MSLRVDLSLVRFSPIEDTYYFYDGRYPTTIQFLRNGKWESWDVGWVRHNAHDHEIKHIAASAEAYAVRHSSSYKQWPSTPVPRVAPVVQPLSPSVQSDVSRQRDYLDRSLCSHEVDYPFSPQFSDGTSQDLCPSTAPNASVPPLYQLRPAFSPASDSPPISRSLPPLERKPASVSEHNHLDLPALTPTPSTLRSTAPAPGPVASLDTFSSSVPPVLPPMSHLPVASPPIPSLDVSAVVFRPPFVSVTPNTAVLVPEPAQQLLVNNSQSSNAHHTDVYANNYPVPAETDPETDPRNDLQLSSVDESMKSEPRAASRLSSLTSSPSDAYDDTYEDTGLALPVQAPQPASLLPRRRRDFKVILSLDGDGVRGLSQVFLVEALVGAICKKLDQNLDPYQIFDLVGGTSMGGVLGLMLSRLRMQAHTAREAYKLIARAVYQDKKRYFISLDPHAVPLLYDTQGVENAIKEIVAGELTHMNARLYDDREDSADAFAITTQVEIGSSKAAVLRTYPTRRIAGPDTSDDILVWQAMKAAVLAPCHANPQDERTSRFVIEPGQMDYGTTKDNPVREANYECRKLLRYSNDKMIVVSIGTGSGINSDQENGEMVKSVLRRNADAERQCFEFQRDNEELINAGWMKYFRFNVSDLDDTSLEEWCNEECIRDKTTAYLACPDTGRAFHRCVDDIAAVLIGRTRQL